MDHDNVIIFWQSPDGKEGWKPVQRDDIPEWLREQEFIDRMIGGEAICNPAIDTTWWKVTVVDRKPVVSELVSAPQKRFGYVHSPGCSCIAFYMPRRILAGDRISTGDLIKADGSLHAPGEPIKCGACGAKIGWDIASGNIVEMS